MILSKEMQEKVLKLLIAEGLLPADTAANTALADLTARGLTDAETVAHAVAQSIGVRYVNLTNVRMDNETLLLLPKVMAERFKVVPLGEVNGALLVATPDVSDVQLADYLTNVVKKPVKVIMTSEAGVAAAMAQYTGDFSSVKNAVKATSAEEKVRQISSNAKTIIQDSPISKALVTILEYAVNSKASDIHIEPLEESLVIRMRIDGVLRQVMELPKSVEAPLVSRVKILAELKIDEHRVPQDGQFTVAVGDKEVDLRIATSPVVWGEQVVIRLLDKTGTTLDIEQMGMTGRALRMVVEGIQKPNGMILTSGPTGSGKSTTLYSLVKRIKSEKINIVTLEDPVEYKMDGVNQIQVNVDAGLTFASGLRSILRQDPDVVMVGEIRDSETANLAVQAALTGHLVFSTLHTNSAAGILPRFLEMGIEPFLLASTLNVVIGQRLVRRVADKREVYQSNDRETAMINEVVGRLLPTKAEDVAKVAKDLGYNGLPVGGASSYKLVRGIDDKDTPDGYKGRAGLYETIEIDDDIQKLIMAHATSSDIMKVAKEKGTVTMREDGVLKALTGVTTISEVNRVASDIA